MNKCKTPGCGSYAINPRSSGRDPAKDLDLCDVCYWRVRAEPSLPVGKEALERIREKLIRMGAKLPIDVKGTIESAMQSGYSLALLLVDEEIAALRGLGGEGGGNV